MKQRPSPIRCAVGIPVHRWPLTEIEALSAINTVSTLAGKPIYWIGPKKLRNEFPKIVRERQVGFLDFDDRYFKSIRSYSKLLISKNFYERLKDYDYLMICQTDALVIRNELERWTEMGYNYIGAPWVQEETACNGSTVKYIGVGNGGFSLRSIPGCINFLNDHYYVPYKGWSRSAGPIKRILRYLKYEIVFSYTIDPFSSTLSEDQFWGIVAPEVDPSFSVPAGEIALKFSFERLPELLYIENNRMLPFGCHAFERYDLAFWKETLGENFFHIDHADEDLRKLVGR